MDSLLADMGADIETGAALGSTSGVTADLSYSQANIVIADIATNIATAITDSNAATGDTTIAAPDAAALELTLGTAATTVAEESATTLRGFAMSANGFTVGGQSFTVAADGVATGGGTTATNNVQLGFTFADYTNGAGSAAGAPSAADATFNFAIQSEAANDLRKVQGSLSPVTVTTYGTGAVSVSVPANAVLTFSGIDSQGVAVTGSVTNIASNSIQTTNSAVSINIGNLLTQVQAKVTADTTIANNAAFDILTTSGSYGFIFGITGIDIGFENGGMNGIANLFPVGGTGREITGIINTAEPVL